MRVQILVFLVEVTRRVALPASVLVSTLAFGNDRVGVVALSNDNDIPVSKVALPFPRALPVQKPTSTAFGLSGHIATEWSIPVNNVRMHSLKPIQTAGPAGSHPCRSSDSVVSSDSAGSFAEGLGIFLPPCVDVAMPDETKSISISTATTDAVQSQGNQKPNAQNPPVVSHIAQVKWNSSATPSTGDRKSGFSPAFQADCCPLVLWNPDALGEFLPESALEEISIGACSDLIVQDSASGKAYLGAATLANTGGIHPSVMEQLQQLNPHAAIHATSGGSYLSDLRQLAGGNSDWLYVNESLLDLAPHEPVYPSASYLDDLNALVAGSVTADPNQHRQTKTPQYASVSAIPVAVDTQAGSRNPYSRLAPDLRCEAIGGSTLESLFQPLSSIHLSGLSTQPPEMDRNQKASELSRPESQACAYLDNASPMHYHASPRHGSSHPSRNTHQLYHNPLYYEDPNIERCGQSYGCLTTAVSVVHFGTAIAFTPFKMAQACPADCVPALPDCPTSYRFDQDAYCSGH